MGAGGNIVTKDEEMPEALKDWGREGINSKSSCSQGTKPPKLEERDRDQNEAPVIQGEIVSDFTAA